MNGASALLTAVGGGIATILGAYSLVVKARGEAARPRQVLRRLVDWLEQAGLIDKVPETLRQDTRDVLAGDDE